MPEYCMTTIMTTGDMGNGVEFFKAIASGGAKCEYEAVGQAKIVGGIKGGIVKRKDATETHSNLPQYAVTSDMYFRKNNAGVCQGRVYLDHKVTLDFDWRHDHTNNGIDGRHFRRGVVHVQIWQQKPDGTFTRISNGARLMNNAEMKQYGPLIKTFCPGVKFR